LEDMNLLTCPVFVITVELAITRMREGHSVVEVKLYYHLSYYPAMPQEIFSLWETNMAF